MDQDAKDALREHGSLKQQRSFYEPTWEDLRRTALPYAKSIYDGANNPGQKNTEEQYDSTPQDAVYKATFGILSLVCPEGDAYQNLSTDDALLKRSQEALSWFTEESTELLQDRYAAEAAFSANNFQTILNGVGFGNGATFVDENPEGGMLYTSIPLKQLFIQRNDQGKMVRWHRYWPMKAYQLVERAQKKGWKLPQEVTDANTRNPYEQFMILHCCWENANYQPGYFDERGMRYRSLLVLEKTQDTLERKGYYSQPLAPLAFWPNAGDDYARSPLMNALADSKMLHKQKKSDIRIRNRAAEPTLLAGPEGTVNKPKMKPNYVVWGGLNARGEQMIRPMDYGGAPQISDNSVKNSQDSVNSSMLTNLLTQFINTPRINEMQALEMMKEKAQILGPSFGVWMAEYFGTMTARELDIRARQARQVPVPEILKQNRKYKTVYTGPLMRMIAASKATTVVNAFVAASPILNAFPEAKANINANKTVRDIFKAYGQGDQLNEEATVQEIQQSERQAQAAASTADMAPKVAAAARDAAIAQNQGAS